MTHQHFKNSKLFPSLQLCFILHTLPEAFRKHPSSPLYSEVYFFPGRLKDGTVAAEQCSRYHMSGNSLVIRDVAEEDAGKYMVLVRNQEHRLYQNLTLTLVVNGEKQQQQKYFFRSNCPVLRDIKPSRFFIMFISASSRLAVSPKIGEKAVLVQDPGSVPRGSRQALRCTSHGVPPPHIQWLWHPCPSKGL